MSSPARKLERTRARSPVKYNTDPPSIHSLGQPTTGNLFDLARIADAMRRGLMEGIEPQEYPNDQLLAATMVSLGMPVFAADQVRYNPALRLNFLRMWSAVQLAAEGHKEAQEVVDVARQAFAEARKAELVTDRPDMSVGFWER